MEDHENMEKQAGDPELCWLKPITCIVGYVPFMLNYSCWDYHDSIMEIYSGIE